MYNFQVCVDDGKMIKDDDISQKKKKTRKRYILRLQFEEKTDLILTVSVPYTFYAYKFI